MTRRHLIMLEVFAKKAEVEQSWNFSPTNRESTDLVRTSNIT